jgi:hypothetical protein
MKQETVIVLLYPGCISYEVSLAAELLSEKYEILNATPDGKDLPTSTSGLSLRTQLSYSEVNLDNCKFLDKFKFKSESENCND